MAGSTSKTTGDRFNVATVVVDAHVAAGHGDRPAIRHAGRTLTYAEVASQVDRTGNALRSLGLEIEDRVAILLPDSPEFVATFLGAIKIGAVPVTLSTLLTERDYAYMLADSRARAVVVHESVLPRVLAVRDVAPRLREVVVSGVAPAGTRALADLVAASSDR